MRNVERTIEPSDSLEAALAEYLRAIETGAPFDREQFLQAYPQHRSELSEFIANHRQAHQLAISLHASVAGETLPLLRELPRGRRIGDYELLELLAHGGMGVVYKARQVSLDRVVALKMISSAIQDPQRFRDEAEAAAALDHPNIVAIYEIGELEGLMYYSMPLIEGSDLRQRLREGALPPRTAAAICSKLAGAVEFAHQRGVLHRDLKPGNVMFDLRDEPIITDFGLAKSLHDDSHRTRSGAVLGTPSYMAPEQASGDNKLVTTAIDVYGLGAVLYAMLTGRAPFEGSGSLQVMRKVEREPPQAPRDLQADIPRDIEMICLKCLQKRPADRYDSARDLQQDLQRFLRHDPVVARPISRLERSWRWYRRNWLLGNLVALLALILVVAAVGGSGLAWREYRARKLAEESGVRERESKQLAFASLVDLHTSNGRQAQIVSRQAEAMVWYATAAHLAAGTPSLDDALVRVQRRQRFVPQPMRAAQIGEGPLDSLSFHPSGRYLLVRDCHQQIWLWDLAHHADPQPISLVRKATVAEWSPDGNLVAVANAAGQLRIHDLRSGATRLHCELPQAVSAICFDPAGGWVAAAVLNQVLLFPLESGETTAEPTPRAIDLPESVLIAHLAVSPSGSHLLAASPDGGTWLLALENAEVDAPESIVLSPPQSPLGDTASPEFMPIWPRFLSDDAVAVVVGQQWNQYATRDGSRQLQIDLGSFASLAVEPQARAILLGSSRSSRIVTLPDDTAPRRFSHREVVSTVDFHPRDPYVVTGCWDGRAQIWDIRDGRAIGDLPHQNRLRAVRFSPDGSLVCTAQFDGLLRVWRWQPDTTTRQRISNPTSETWAKTNGEQSAWFLAGTPTDEPSLRTIQLHRFDDPSALPEALEMPGALCDADFSDRDRVLIAGLCMTDQDPADTAATAAGKPDAAGQASAEDTAAATIRYELHGLRWPEGTTIHAPLPLPARPISVHCQRDGKLVAVACEDRQLWLVDRETGRIAKQIELPALESNRPLDRHARTVFSADGQWLLCCGPGQPLSLFHRRDHWSPVNAPRPREACVFAEFSPQSSEVVAVFESGTAVVWDLHGEQEAGPPISHNERVFRARFSPDGQLLATACADNFARIYRWRTGTLACQSITNRADVFDVAFSPNGRWLLTVGPNALMGIWSTRDGGFVDQIPIAPTANAQESSEHGAQLLISASGSHMLIAGRRSAIEWIGVGELNAQPVADLTALKTTCELTASARIEHGGASPLLLQEWLDAWRFHIRDNPTDMELSFPDAPEFSRDPERAADPPPATIL